jgi:hemolysin III
MQTVDHEPVKPLLRGVSHQVSFFVSLVAGVLMVALAPHAIARVGVGVYMTSLTVLFGTSALYHRKMWGPKARALMRRCDHAAIFVLIAGTATPFALTLPAHARNSFLAIAWGGAALGVLRALLWINAPKPLVALLAIGVGWAAVPFIPELRAAAGLSTVLWIGAGGALYSLGAGVYAFRRPNPWPRVFGYHEIFHALVILAALCHFAGVVQAVRLISP